MFEPKGETNSILLRGLDGSNPLAFLAALGTLRTLTMAWVDHDVKMSWRLQLGAWRPVLCADHGVDADQVIQVLGAALRGAAGCPAFALADDLKVSRSVYRDYASKSVASAETNEGKHWTDFAAAFGCDAFEREGNIEDTAFRTMSGAGHQHFLKFMRDLADTTTEEHLRKSLMDPWAYEDDGPSLRWDPEDDRRYALRWGEPSGDPIRTVRGANRLATEGLPLLPAIPDQSRLSTTGFSGIGSRNTYWSWPIWTSPLACDPVRSLLSLEELQRHTPPRTQLALRGIVEVYRSQRITQGKYRNFAPARAV